MNTAHTAGGQCLCGCALAEAPSPTPAIAFRNQQQVVGVLGTGSCVPERVVPNSEIAPAAGVDDAWIVRKTGISERRWIDTQQATSDLAAVAAERAIAAAGIAPEQISLIVLATSTPDQPQPPTAVHVQRKIGASNAFAFDMNSVCSGFVFAMASAQALLLSAGGYGLVIGADIYSQILDPSDRRTVVLFGDGAGAMILGPPEPDRPRLSAMSLHSDGTQAHVICVPSGGSRMPTTPDTLRAGCHYFTMDGRTVREFVCSVVPQMTAKFLANASVPADTIEHFVPHQANGVMLDELFTAVDLPNATMHQTVSHYGNTGAASIAITLDQAVRAGALTRGTSLLAAFGGGMSVGLGLIEW